MAPILLLQGMMTRSTISIGLFVVLLQVTRLPADGAVKHKKEAPGDDILWRSPADIGSRNLFYGPGGKAHLPSGPFTFEKEDLDGTNPKFVVRDASGEKWKVKLGAEARPETVATRFVWAVGYSANEDYFLPVIKVSELPAKLKRGDKFRDSGDSFRNVRLKREDKDAKKLGSWSWSDNPFAGTREMNGLRVMMALIDNWDLKDENNAISANHAYLVSDLGSSFGANGFSGNHDRDKGNLHSFEHAGFIRKTTPKYVDFDTPARPGFFILFNPPEYFSRTHLESVGKHIPRKDAVWIGKILAQLSSVQVRDAFRAADYSPDQVEGFAKVMDKRIGQLNHL